MECDSVHKNVEAAKKRNGEINLPTDYVQLIRNARKKPYGVKYCDYTFFKDYKAISDVKTIKPTKETGAPYVVDIRQLKYTSTGDIFTNLTFDNESWVILPLAHFKRQLRQLEPAQTREEPIKISFAKWTHLQEICEQSLSQEYHWYYKNLAHHEPKQQEKQPKHPKQEKTKTC